jgi:hypothetical protein
MEEDLAEGDDRELKGETASLPDPALDGLRKLAEVTMAVVQIAGRIDDADDRLAESIAAVAHGTSEGATNEESELAVSVLGEAAAQP